MDTKITLAIISPVFPPYRSGQGTVAQENARMAAERGMQTTVFTPRYKEFTDVPSCEHTHGTQIERLRPLFSFGNAAFVPQLFLKLRTASVIHLHYPALGMELPVLFWRALGKRVVITYHMDLVGKGLFMRFFFRIYSLFFLPMMVSAASHVFVTSYDYAEHSRLLGALYRKNKQKIVELPCSVNTEKFHPDLRAERPYMLFVGALDSAHYSKGVPLLLEAFARVDPSHGCNLVIIGDGNLRAQYEGLSRSHGVAARVHFVGSVSHEDLVRWYTGALFLVLPSTDTTEAFGVVIIEAAASGIPALATRLPGVRSVIQDGATGLLVEPNNVLELVHAMERLLSDVDQTHAMGQAARKRALERYSYDVVGRKYINVLDR